MKQPAEVARGYIAIGKAKTEQTTLHLLLLGALAGAFIAMAGVAATFGNVYLGRVAGAAIFPAGLTMVLIAGSELFTGNCLLVIPLLEHEIRLRALLRNWVLVYLGNFIGSVLVAGLTVAAGTFDAVSDAVIATAELKANLSFGAALLRGVLCNFLVCIAVWMSFAGTSVGGKLAGLYGPIFVFVLSGFEHSIANMFYIPAGLFLGAGLTWEHFLLGSLLPVTLGNLLGGCLVGVVYWTIYLRKAENVWTFTDKSSNLCPNVSRK